MAKKITTDTPAETPALVTVRVVQQPIYENDAHQAKGSTFETTAERASALGALVEIITE